jgi:hypothetical protein
MSSNDFVPLLKLTINLFKSLSIKFPDFTIIAMINLKIRIFSIPGLSKNLMYYLLKV